MFGENITVFQSLQLTAIAMSIVFVLLLLVQILVDFLGRFASKFLVEAKKPIPVKPAVTVSSVKTEKELDIKELTDDEDKLIAAFVASIEASKSNTDTRYKVVNLKKI